MSKKPFAWQHNPGFGTFTWLVLAFLYVPLAVLFVFSFNANRQVTVWSHFSFKWFAVVAQDGNIRLCAYNSLIVAVVATILSVAIAIPAALALERGTGFKGRGLSIGLITMPLVVPEIVTAIATLIFFSSVGMTDGIVNLIIAHTVFCIPFALLPIQARIQALGGSFEDAARDLYGSEWRIFRRITVPLLMPGIVSGAVLAFVISLDDFLISFMVSSSGSTTLPVYVYGMMRLGVTPEVNAISTILLVVSAILAAVAFIFTRPPGGESPAKSTS